MTAVADVAFGSAWPRATPPRWATALAAVSLGVFGVLSSVYWFAGEGTYRDLMRGTGPVTLGVDGATWTLNEEALVSLHRETLRYLLDLASELPRGPDGGPVFDAAERSHMADVKGVFRAVGIAWIVSGALLGALVVRGRLRGYLALMMRDAATLAGSAVLVLALVAAVAFVPAFLLFHQVFFPQGNFLFDPATSDLLRVYPEHYWYGVTLRVFGGFCALSLIVAGALTLWLRSARS
ncbi:MAG: DUF1461 domain-containing protein [Candidatus Limnocylindria bacterium]